MIESGARVKKGAQNQTKLVYANSNHKELTSWEIKLKWNCLERDTETFRCNKYTLSLDLSGVYQGI